MHVLFSPIRFDLVAFMRALAAIHAIEEINASGFLPGVRLGYVMYDTCSDPTKALQSVAYMLALNNSLSVECEYTDFRPPVKVIIGARFSEVSIAVAKLLGVYMVPQLSCTSSSPALSDKLRYPAFLRTIPSDVHQTKALAKLMAKFNWNWVGVIYGDDDYGKAAFQSFLRDAEEMNVCLAYQEVVPHYLDHEHSKQRIKEVAQQIRSSKAQVVLLILKSKLVERLFQEMILTNTSRTWIASDAWSRNRPLARMDGINKVGDIFGFTFVSRKSESFDNYLKNLRPSPGGYNHFIEKYKNLRFNCTPECFSTKPPSYCPKPSLLKIKSDNACSYTDPQEANDDFLVKALDTSEAYSAKVAGWAIAHALKKLLKCNNSACSGELNFQPWKLLEELKKVHFHLDKQAYFFDKSGDFVNGYDLVMWKMDGCCRTYVKLGTYHVLHGRIELDADISEINWFSTANNSIPTSRCSESCAPGSVKKISNVSCCYNCTPCGEGTFSDSSDLSDCRRCSNGTWSLKGWTHCEPRKEIYLKWRDAHPIALVASAVFGVLLLLVIFIIFMGNRNSQAMRRAEVRLSCVMMTGLAVSFASVICFMGKPNVHLCRARQVMYAMGFTLCVSCILVKAFRTFLAFLPFGQLRHRRLNRLYKPPIIVAVVTLLQVIICTLWLIFDSPDVDRTPPKPQSMDRIIRCNEGSTFIGFGIMLSYIALLAFVGFLLAFKGRKVPQEFSETGYIIFSMLMYLFVWVCFIPIYIIKTGEGAFVQASAILVSTYGIIFCHFLPKCYEALRGSNEDTMERILRRWRTVTSPTPHQDIDSDRDSGVISDIQEVSIVSQGTESLSRSSTLDATGSTETLSQTSSTGSNVVIISMSNETIGDLELTMIPGTQLRKRFRSLTF
ncbi:olfactory receptor CB1 [Polymixia lowei]